MNTSSLLRLCPMLLCTALLAGCGTTPKSTTTTNIAPATNLQGTWLLAGSIPNVVNGTAGGVTITINVTGTTIMAAANWSDNCTSFQAPITNGGGAFLKGVILADDTFVIDSSGSETPTSSDTTVFTGSIPQTAGGDWKGSYKLGSGGECTPDTFSGDIAATSISQLSGTFSGSATTQSLDYKGAVTPTQMPITASLDVQQGGTLYYLTPPVASSYALTGSVKIQGISCFSHGTSSTTETSLLIGNEPELVFNMDDGATLTFGFGSVIDADSTTMEWGNFAVSGDSCAGVYVFPTATPLTLTK